MIKSLEEKISYFESFRGLDGINPVPVCFLKGLDPFDHNFVFNGKNPRSWTATDWAGAGSVALTLLNSIPAYKAVLWNIFFCSVEITSKCEDPDLADVKRWGNEAEKLINQMIWDLSKISVESDCVRVNA